MNIISFMKRFFILPVCAAAVFSLFAVTCSAQDVSKKEALASELVDLLNVKSRLDTAFEAAPKLQQQMMDTQRFSPEQRESIRKHVQASMEAVKRSMNWQTMKPAFVKIYADAFDESDLEGMIVYYKGPVGQKWIEKQPQIQAATMQVIGQIIPQIQAAIMKGITTSDVQAAPKPTSTP